MQPVQTGFLPPDTPRAQPSRAAGVMLLISAAILLLCLYLIPTIADMPLDPGFTFFAAAAKDPVILGSGFGIAVLLTYLSLLFVLLVGLPAAISGSRGANIGAGVVGTVTSFIAFIGVAVMFGSIISHASLETAMEILGIGFYLIWLASILILVAGIMGFVGAAKVKKSMSTPPPGAMSPMGAPGHMPPPPIGQQQAYQPPRY